MITVARFTASRGGSSFVLRNSAPISPTRAAAALVREFSHAHLDARAATKHGPAPTRVNHSHAVG